MKIGILSDPIKNLNPKSDSTLYIYDLLKKHNHHPLLFTQSNLKISLFGAHNESSVFADCFSVDKNYEASASQTLNLNHFDIILLRQEPPLNINYSINVQIIHSLSRPKVLNNPKTLLTFPEKFIPLAFKHHMPDTIVTRSTAEIIEYIKFHKRAVLKSIHGYGGNDVILVENDDPSLQITVEKFIKTHNCIIAQEFLPNIEFGDKRVLMINGNLAGTLRRIPKKGSILSNMVQGASGEICNLDTKEKQIIAEVGPWLKKNGVFFAGLDLIDHKLIEVNITCPTGYKVYANLASLNSRIKAENLMIKELENSLSEKIEN